MSLTEILPVLMAHYGFHDSASSKQIKGEMEKFLRTGDFEPKADGIVCVNPTLLTLDETTWQVIALRRSIKYSDLFSTILFYLGIPPGFSIARLLPPSINRQIGREIRSG